MEYPLLPPFSMHTGKIPVTLITGFLGSGKTTLLNRLLADGVKSALLINEFGETPVDQDLLARQQLPLTLLSGGCLCCQVKGALAPALKNLWMTWREAEIKPFERMLIETSGVASPEPILDTLLREPWLSKHYRLDLLITTLAIPSACDQLQRYPQARAQVVWADLLLLTHADLANSAQQAAVNQALHILAPATPRLLVDWHTFAGDRLNPYGKPLFRRMPYATAMVEHGFQSLSLYLLSTPSWPEFQRCLTDVLAKHGDLLLRIKGVIFPPDNDEPPFAVQAAAGRLYPPQTLSMQPGSDRRSRLVCIVSGDVRPLAQTLNKTFSEYIGANAIKLHCP